MGHPDPMTYNEPTTPHTLTDERAGYDAPSEAALEAAGKFFYASLEGDQPLLTINDYLWVTHFTLFEAEKSAQDLQTAYALALDAFAAQAVEAALNHAQYIHDLESDDKADKAVAAREAQYNALKAVADKMAVAIRSVETDAVVENGYEGDGYDYEFPVHIIDSDYMNTLYQALREYEQVTDPAPKLQTPKCPSCKGAGYVWLTETPDTGHDYQMNCPVCNPKVDLYAADRYESDF